MIFKRAFDALPGPIAVKVALAAIIVAMLLVMLVFVYDWMGQNLLDSGGAIS